MASALNPFQRFLVSWNCVQTSVRNIKTRGKARGIKVYVGQDVHPGHVLFKQIKMRIHPGINVNMRNDMTIVSLKEGKVYITCEVVKPKLNSVFIQHFYAKRDLSQQFYKKYIHVIPQEQEKIFRLVDRV